MKREVVLMVVVLGIAGCVAPATRGPAPTRSVADTAEPGPGCNPLTTECGGAPPIPATLASTITTTPSLSHFHALAAAGDLPAILEQTRPATVTAPNDEAFARLPSGVYDSLLLPGNRPTLRRLLRFWIVPERLSNETLETRTRTGASIPTLEGEPLHVAGGVTSGTIVFVDAHHRAAKIVGESETADGTLLLIDGIIAPRSIEPGAGMNH